MDVRAEARTYPTAEFSRRQFSPYKQIQERRALKPDCLKCDSFRDAEASLPLLKQGAPSDTPGTDRTPELSQPRLGHRILFEHLLALSRRQAENDGHLGGCPCACLLS
jgi:hypothetical protein